MKMIFVWFLTCCSMKYTSNRQKYKLMHPNLWLLSTVGRDYCQSFSLRLTSRFKPNYNNIKRYECCRFVEKSFLAIIYTM